MSINKTDPVSNFNNLYNAFQTIVAAEGRARAHHVWESNLGKLKDLHAHMLNTLNEIPDQERFVFDRRFAACTLDLNNLQMSADEGKSEEPVEDGQPLEVIPERCGQPPLIEKYLDIHLLQKIVRCLPTSCSPISRLFHMSEHHETTKLTNGMLAEIHAEKEAIIEFVLKTLALPQRESETMEAILLEVFNTSISGTEELKGVMGTKEKPLVSLRNFGQKKWELRSQLVKDLTPLFARLKPKQIETLLNALCSAPDRPYSSHFGRTLRLILATCQYNTFSIGPVDFGLASKEDEVDVHEYQDKVHYDHLMNQVTEQLERNNPEMALAFARNYLRHDSSKVKARAAFENIFQWLLARNQFGEILAIVVEESSIIEGDVFDNEDNRHLSMHQWLLDTLFTEDSFSATHIENILSLYHEEPSTATALLFLFSENYPSKLADYILEIIKLSYSQNNLSIKIKLEEVFTALSKHSNIKEWDTATLKGVLEYFNRKIGTGVCPLALVPVMLEMVKKIPHNPVHQVLILAQLPCFACDNAQYQLVLGILENIGEANVVQILNDFNVPEKNRKNLFFLTGIKF